MYIASVLVYELVTQAGAKINTSFLVLFLSPAIAHNYEIKHKNLHLFSVS